MGKPSAPDTLQLHLPDPTGRDAHDSPYWWIGPILVTVDVIASGPDVGRHGVFVVAFDPVPAGRSADVAAAVLAADKAAKAADARAEAADTRAKEVERIARETNPADLLKALYSAMASRDVESANLFGDALDWQAANPLTGAAS